MKDYSMNPTSDASTNGQRWFVGRTAAERARAIAEHCGPFKAEGDGWKACCPAHDDANPSLSIKATGDKVLLYCRAHCTYEAVVQALGLTSKDLRLSPSSNGHAPIVAAYDYTDADGHLLYQVVRCADHTFPQRRPDPVNPGEYLWGLGGIQKVLYGLPALRKAVAEGRTIFLPEGEKDVETVLGLGLSATCNPGGAGKWDVSYSEAFRGATVVLLPDNDKAGRDHVALVAQHLKGIAASVTILSLAGLPPKGDVSDWVQAGHTKTELEALVQAAKPAERRKAVRIKGSDLLAKELPPLMHVVEGILPAGSTLLTGKSKDGKSLMAYNLAVAVVTGGKALGVYKVAQGNVWYLALEDGERRAQKRLKMQETQAGELSRDALERIEFTLWDAPRLGEGLEEDIRHWIETTPDARLIIIDILEKVRPLRKRNGSIYAEDYQATEALTRLAQDNNVAILIVHHANKLNPEDFRDSSSGAMSLLGGADNFWSLKRMPMSEEATLSITGRDIEEEQALAMQFKDGYWTVIGDGVLASLSKERKEILAVLQTSPRPMTPKQVAEAIGRPYEHTKVLMFKMKETAALIQPAYGQYAPSPTLYPSGNSGNSGNSSNPDNSGNSSSLMGARVTGELPRVTTELPARKSGEALIVEDVTGKNAARVTRVTGVSDKEGKEGRSETPPCYNCRGTRFWFNSAHQPICSRCHPQAGMLNNEEEVS